MWSVVWRGHLPAFPSRNRRECHRDSILDPHHQTPLAVQHSPDRATIVGPWFTLFPRFYWCLLPTMTFDHSLLTLSSRRILSVSLRARYPACSPACLSSSGSESASRWRRLSAGSTSRSCPPPLTAARATTSPRTCWTRWRPCRTSRRQPSRLRCKWCSTPTETVTPGISYRARLAIFSEGWSGGALSTDVVPRPVSYEWLEPWLALNEAIVFRFSL